MMAIQRAVVVALDPAARKVSREITTRLADYRLADGLPFPDNLWQEIWITDSADKQAREGTTGAEAELSPTEKLSLADLGAGLDAFSDAFCLGVLNTVQLDADQYLRTSRAFDPRPKVSFYLVGSLWESSFQPAILRALEAIHSRPEGRGGSDVFLVLLLPELGQTEAGGAEEAQVRRARAFAALREIESLVQETAGTPWEDWFPVDRVWICGGQDYNGRGLGNLEAVSRLLGEGIATLISENALEYQATSGGTDPRETRDSLGNARYYGSIGFAQLTFPREALRAKLFERVRTRVYEDYILRNARLVSDELVITARSFLTNELSLQTVADRLKQTSAGDRIVSDFAFPEVDEGATEDFLGRIDSAVEEYREKPLAAAKLAFMERADGIADELTVKTQGLFRRWIDDPGYGPVQTSALAGEILGESGLSTREDRRPIGHFMCTYRCELDGLLSLQRSLAAEPDVTFPEEGRDGGSASRLATPAAIGAPLDAPSTGEGEDWADIGNAEGLTSEGAEVDRRRTVFEEIDRLGHVVVAGAVAALRTLDRTRAETRRQIEHLRDRIGGIILRLLVWQPALALLGYGFSALGWHLVNQHDPRYGGIATFLHIVFGDDRWQFHVLGSGLYLALAAWEYMRLVWLPLRRLLRQEGELHRQELAQRQVVVRDWRQFFSTHMQARTFDHAIGLLQKVTENVGGLRSRIDSFIETARCAIQAVAIGEGQTAPATREVISTSEDIEYFESICFDRPIPEEVEPVFLPEKGGASLSDLVWRGGDCVADLERGIRAFFDERFDSRLGRLSIEELLMEHWEHIHPSVSPQRRASEVFALSPFVQLESPPGEPKVGQNYTVGIYQGEQSRFIDFLGEAPPFPFTVFPCSSRERILIFCQTASFSVASLAKLRSYRQAFDKLAKGKTQVVFYPEDLATRKPPNLIPSG
jgi:hypothetical protein